MSPLVALAGVLAGRLDRRWLPVTWAAASVSMVPWARRFGSPVAAALVAGRRPVGAGRGAVGHRHAVCLGGAFAGKDGGCSEAYDLFRLPPALSGHPHRRSGDRCLPGSPPRPSDPGQPQRTGPSRRPSCCTWSWPCSTPRPGTTTWWPQACGTTIRRWSPGSPWAGCPSRNTPSLWCRPSWPACGCCS